MEGRIKGIEFTASSESVHINNSYLVESDELKLEIIRYLLANVEGFAEHRTEKGLLDEWRVHNALYQRGKYVSHTQHVDFEFKQKWYYAVAYWFVARFLKER